MLKLLLQLIVRLDRRRKRQLVYLFLLMLIVSLLEIVSLGAIIPFVGVLVDPEKFIELENFRNVFIVLNLTEAANLRFSITVAFSIVIFLSSLSRLSLLLLQSRLGYAIGADLGYQIYRNVLNRSYQDHITNNSSVTVSAITKKTNSCVSSSIIPFMNVVASSITCSFVVIALVLVDPSKTFLILVACGALYLLIWLSIKNKIKNNSINIAKKHDDIVKHVVEGLRSFRNVIIDGTAYYYLNIFHNADVSLRKSLASNQFNAESPKYFMEALGMLIIAWFAYLSIKSGATIEEFLPVIGVLVLGAQRILPVLQKGYAGWTQMKGEMSSLNDVVDILLECDSAKQASIKTSMTINFNHTVKFENLYFKYLGADKHTLMDLSFTIKKGEIIGIIGASGSGKSTLLDIILGLLKPSTGKIFVDGKKADLYANLSWYDQISHVPQSIYLTDASIAENIAFGEDLSKINVEKIQSALDIVCLGDLAAVTDDLFSVKLGENGANLSGGQVQRIGIARAIYRDKPFILLDEATSALDETTEASVLSNLVNAGKTILLITHKKSNLRFCDTAFSVACGKIRKFDNYKSGAKDAKIN